MNPHAHADFEEGSLMGPGTLVVIAPGTMRVAEAIGDERHVLMNLFAPPRRDHIAKGQILNASEYASAKRPL